jgi:diketogulonate reductase-like aldo/keto reductase
LGYASTKIEFEKSLKRLNPDYVDLYLIDWAHKAKNHDDWPDTNAATWQANEKLQAERRIKSIGVRNFFEEHFAALSQTAIIIPAANHIKFHPRY